MFVPVSHRCLSVHFDDFELEEDCDFDPESEPEDLSVKILGSRWTKEVTIVVVELVIGLNVFNEVVDCIGIL